MDRVCSFCPPMAWLTADMSCCAAAFGLPNSRCPSADISTRAELDAKGADYIIIAPEPYQENEWTARWLKAGSSVESIKKRLARWAANHDFYYGSRAPLALIPCDKWLAQMLEQDKAGEADRKDT